MEDSILFLSPWRLAIAFIPVLGVLYITYAWSLNFKNTLYALGRMLVQLIIIGYLLTYIFESDSMLITIIVLMVMIFFSGWIALLSISELRRDLITKALYAIILGGGVTLIIISQGVLSLKPWYFPRYLIPLAGMIFANAKNTVSLAAERFKAETERGVLYEEARKIAMRAALIPVINALFAVGLVSLPGMMTGQILSGVSPLMAVRYQIMVMCMIFSSAGFSTFLFLIFIKNNLTIFKKVSI